MTVLESVEKRFGNQLPTTPVQWISDNGPVNIAEQTCFFARQIGVQPVTTPVRSPQSNGMAENFVKTIKRDYVAQMPKLDRKTVLRNLTIAFDHYNERHPHNALKYRSPRECRCLAAVREIGVRFCRGSDAGVRKVTWLDAYGCLACHNWRVARSRHPSPSGGNAIRGARREG